MSTTAPTTPEVPGRPAVTFPALDTMRAIAAIAVLGTHASFWGGAYSRSGYGTALARLDFGVAIFFVLSGFLLSRPWFGRQSRELRAPATTPYLWKRALRILPVYWIAAVAALLLLPGNDDASLATWLQTLTLTNIYVGDQLPDGLTQMWSLATEAAFYLVLPAVMWLALSRRRPRLGTVIGALVAVNVAWIVVVSQIDWLGDGMHSTWLPAYLTWFCAGILIGACSVRVDLPGGQSAVPAWLADGARRMGRAPGACWTAGLALFAVASTPVAGPTLLVPPGWEEAVAKNLLYAVIAALLILPGVFGDPDGAYVRVMSLTPLRHLGHISYGVFCVHLLILEEVARWRDMELFAGRTLELFLITLVLSLLVSEALYRLVERPSMRWKNRGPGRASRVRPSRAPSPTTTSS